MRHLFQLAALAAFALAAGACGASSAHSPAPSAVDVVESPAPASPHGARGGLDPLTFWTPARMRSARPLDTLTLRQRPATDDSGERGKQTEVGGGGGSGASSVPGAPAPRANAATDLSYRKFFWGGRADYLPASSIGRLFFDDGKYLYSCSGAVVNATNRSLVWTAGHCLYDAESKRYRHHFVFVPGYRAGGAPLGKWEYRTAVVLRGWEDSGDHAYDFGALVLARNGGEPVQDATGAQGIRWWPAGRFVVDAFGYPGDPPYDGERLAVCEAATGPKGDVGDGPPATELGCDMTVGASGGPWITELRRSRGWGYVVSVTSANYRGHAVAIGPYHGRGAKNLFDYAERR
jgi:V8-like Glu-specific endopeptidase